MQSWKSAAAEVNTKQDLNFLFRVSFVGGAAFKAVMPNLFRRRAKFKTLKDLRAAQPKIIVQKWALFEGLGAQRENFF